MVGDLNIRLAPDYGDEAVRYSLVAVSVLPLLAVASYLLLARTLGSGRAGNGPS